LRKWTKSACVVLAWCVILPVLMAMGSTGSNRLAQVNTPIASSTRVTVTRTPVILTAETVHATTAPAAATWVVQPGDTLSAIAAALDVPGGWQALYAANRSRIGPNPNVIEPGTILVLPGKEESVRYTVAPGDTLSGIAAQLAVPGGWQALYAANRQAIGPDPDLIRPGTVLVVVPHTTTPPAPRRTTSARGHAGQGHNARTGHSRTGKTRASPSQAGRSDVRRQVPPPALAGTQPPSSHVSLPSVGMPRWLEDMLLGVGVLVVISFLTELVLAMGRRYRQTARHARRKAKIILADHERLIVTYSVRDHAVYVLTPPGEDPRIVLQAARLVLPDETYVELAGHLGVAPDWPSD
jgi:LysM repeat protein